MISIQALLLAFQTAFSTCSSLSARRYAPKQRQWKIAKPPHRWHLIRFSARSTLRRHITHVSIAETPFPARFPKGRAMLVLEAPEGTAAEPRDPSSRRTITWIVGFPLESRISRAVTLAIAVELMTGVPLGCLRFRVDSSLRDAA